MGFLCASTIREYPLHLQYSTLPAAMTKHLLKIVKNLKVIKEFLFYGSGSSATARQPKVIVRKRFLL